MKSDLTSRLCSGVFLFWIRWPTLLVLLAKNTILLEKHHPKTVFCVVSLLDRLSVKAISLSHKADSNGVW